MWPRFENEGIFSIHLVPPNGSSLPSFFLVNLTSIAILSLLPLSVSSVLFAVIDFPLGLVLLIVPSVRCGEVSPQSVRCVTEYRFFREVGHSSHLAKVCRWIDLETSLCTVQLDSKRPLSLLPPGSFCTPPVCIGFGIEPCLLVNHQRKFPLSSLLPQKRPRALRAFFF